MPDLREALNKAGISLDAEAVSRLNRYHEMLLDWNTRMDLTSVTEQDMAARHFVDSLLPLTQKDLLPSGIRLIDVGTGAGFPGLALAAARLDFSVTLLEAQGKRCQFLNAVIDDLQLKNVKVIQDRAEVLGQHPDHREQYDRAVARAVAPLNVLCEYLLPFVKVGGYALCWKGPAAGEEGTDGAFAATMSCMVRGAWSASAGTAAQRASIRANMTIHPDFLIFIEFLLLAAAGRL